MRLITFSFKDVAEDLKTENLHTTKLSLFFLTLLFDVVTEANIKCIQRNHNFIITLSRECGNSWLEISLTRSDKLLVDPFCATF